MNALSWFIVVSVAAVAAFVALWDEDMTPRAQAWLEAPRVGIAASDNGYFSLMGMIAGVDTEPHALGRRRVQMFELSRSRSDPGAEPNFEDYPAAERLSMGNDIESLCKLEKRACLTMFVDQADTIRALELRHQVLLDRYEALREFERFSTTATASLYEPLFPAAVLSAAQRLHNARVALEFAAGSRLRAVQRLAVDIRFQRLLLAEADTVVMKLLASEMLARDLHLFAEFLDSGDFVHRHLPSLDEELADLTEDERDLGDAIQREFRALAETLLTLPASQTIGLDVDVPNWMAGILYKPNATLNRVWREFDKLRELAGLPVTQLKPAWQQPLATEPGPLEYALNPIGSVLAEVSAPSLKPYIARLADTAGLLRLVRLKRDFRATGDARDQIERFVTENSGRNGNPYSGVPMSWNERRQIIFFEGLSDLAHLTEVELAGP